MITISYVVNHYHPQTRFKRPLKESVELQLNGWVRLEHRGSEVQLRRKGLALLCYLGLEGPTERDHLTYMLWGNGVGSCNLRVELHRLRSALSHLNIDLFKNRQNPLRLSKNVAITPPKEKRDGLDILRGLDDISPQYQDWLELKRATFSKPETLSIREALVEEIAAELRFPYLLITQGQPEAGQLAFAQSLARELGLPFISGEHSDARAVRYIGVAASSKANKPLMKRILNDRDSVWIIERSAFGEDSPFLLELRGYYRADKTRFVRLPNLSWQTSRQSYLKDLEFKEAAALYCTSGGHPGYLAELLALRQPRGYTEHFPLPQRIRAAYQLEARSLSHGARYALERLSVHPGSLEEGLLQAFEAKAFLDELECHGWLVFEGKWRFIDNVVRRVLYESLPEGQRRRYHLLAAQQFAAQGNETAHYYHCQQVNETADPKILLEHVDSWAKSVLAPEQSQGTELTQQAYAVGEEQVLLEKRKLGDGIDLDDTSVTIVRNSLTPAISQIEFDAPDGAQLLHIRAKTYVDNPLDIGLSGQAFALRLSLLGAKGQTIYFASAPTIEKLNKSTWLFPLEDATELWLRAEGFSGLRIESAAADAILELDLRIYNEGVKGETVSAYDLS